MIIKDLLTIILTYTNKNNILNLRLVNKKLKVLVYKFSRLNVKTRNKEKCYKVINICKKIKLNITYHHDLQNEDLTNLKNSIICLDLYDNKTITDAGIKNLKNLTSLEFYDNKIITDSSIKNLKNLTHLDLTNNYTITDLSIKNLKKITSLDLTCNKAITDDGIKYLKNLTSLNLYMNSIITDAGIKDLKKLTRLRLDKNETITL